MRKTITLALASVSLAALSSAASAQTAAGPAAGASAQEATLGEIVVTARRRSESLQEVPQTVNAVTSDTLQKLNIRQFQDVQAVVPGLSLATTATGYQNSASLRGVSFEVNTGASPTVAFYLNDAPVQLGFVFQSMFDVGQIEVLKGPQGTTRGISAPSGAITLTTRKPDLSEFGGYVDVTGTDQHGRNVQGALNVPIIKDVLGIRVAALMDINDQDGVRSIHSAIRPRGKTNALRATVSFEPSDLFNANVTYQELDNDLTNFVQVTGPGQGPFTLGDTLFSGAVNPPLGVRQRAAVQDAPNDSRTHEEVVTAQIDSRFLGQHLSYVGSYASFRVNVLQESGSPSFGDVGNILPGVAIFQRARTQSNFTTQEVRLASDPAPGRFFDYTVGVYYSWNPTTGHIDQPGPLTPGAFGSPALAPDMQAFNPAYQIPIAINLDNASQETSVFGSVTLHLPWDTELSGGIRHMWSIAENQTTLTLANGQLALPSSLFGGNCAAVGFTSTYPGFCDFQLAGGSVISNLKTRGSETPNIYNVSLSHHFTRDLLAYVNTGTAYRPPVASVGIQGQLANFTLPDGGSLSFHPSERSRSYEVGFKSTWLDGRWRLNASMFRQRFTNFTLYVPNVSYNNVLPGQPTTPVVPTTFNFTASVDALVQGFDVDTAFQITPNWNVSAQMSYADGKVTGSQVPCNITDAAGQPVYNTGGLISFCPGGSASRLPFWNATFQTEYTRPITDKADGFLRVLATYYPENKNRAEPNFTVDNYALLNVYAGVRSHDGAWEASIFARNALNVARATDISSVAANLNTSLSQFFPTLIHPSGYFQSTTTAAREVGINVHYAFGSR